MNVYKKISISVMCIVYTQAYALPGIPPASVGLPIVHQQSSQQQSSAAAQADAQSKVSTAPSTVPSTAPSVTKTSIPSGSSTTAAPSTQKVQIVTTTTTTTATTPAVPKTIAPVQKAPVLASSQSQPMLSKVVKKNWGKSFSSAHKTTSSKTATNRMSATPAQPK